MEKIMYGGRVYVERVILARVWKTFKDEKAATMKKIWRMVSGGVYTQDI